MNASTLVPKLWNCCNILREGGMSCGDNVEQLTDLLLLQIAGWRSRPPAKLRRAIVDLANDEDGSSMGAYVKGDACESLLEKNAHGTKSGAGQYFKPRAQQLVQRSGGPPFEMYLSTSALLRQAFADLDIGELLEYEAELAEGSGHHGRSALIGLVARRPAAAS